MTDQTADTVPTDEVYVSATLAYSEGPEVTLRQVMFGLAPAVLIEPDVDEEAGRYGFQVSSVDLEADDLVSILRLCADNIERAADRDQTKSEAEQP